jgi:hypothetical protein
MRGIVAAGVVAIVAFTAPSSAGAAEDRDKLPFYVLSEGTATCGEFTAEPHMQTVRMSWVLGYISGRNREAPKGQRFAGSGSPLMPGTVLGWLQSYCASHALAALPNAVDALRADLQAHEPSGK